MARDRVVDAAVAIGVAAVLTLVVSADQGGQGSPAAYLWAAGLGVLMFWRRRYAMVVLVLTVLGLFAYYAAGFPAIGVALPVVAALYSATEAGRRRAAVGAGMTVLAVSVGFRLAEGQNVRYVVLYEGVSHVALMAAAIALGELIRARRHIAALTGRQVALAAEHRLAEHSHALSRDLHDSIGHTLTVAAIHTNVARQEAVRHPETAQAAMDQVTHALSEALTQLRATVRELRTQPQPSLDDLDAVVGVARAAGFEVRTRVEPVTTPSISVAAYRLVQEAVTNVLRHSNGRLIDIAVRRAGPTLLIQVEDDGNATAMTEGAGLAGLRERIMALGGHLEVGPAECGWRVSAALPLGVNDG